MDPPYTGPWPPPPEIEAVMWAELNATLLKMARELGRQAADEDHKRAMANVRKPSSLNPKA